MISQAAHGCSVVRVAKDPSGKWDVEFDDRNRRITVNTPVVFDGPAGERLGALCAELREVPAAINAEPSTWRSGELRDLWVDTVFTDELFLDAEREIRRYWQERGHYAVEVIPEIGELGEEGADAP